MKLREARRDRPIHHDPDSTIQVKVTRKKKQVKFVSLLDVLSICLFQLHSSLVIKALRISTNLLPLLASGSELLLSLKSRSENAT